MIFQTIPFFVDRNRIFVDQTCLGRIRFLCFNDRDTRLCCNTGQYPEKSCVWNTDKVLIVTGAKVDFLLLVFVVSADDDLYFVFQAEIHDIVSCLIEKVVDPAGSFL